MEGRWTPLGGADTPLSWPESRKFRTGLSEEFAHHGGVPWNQAVELPDLDPIPDEETCLEWLKETNPHLSGKELRPVPGRCRAFREARTKRMFSAGVGTVFRSANLRLRQWFRAVLFIAQRKRMPRSWELEELIGCTSRAAYSMRRAIRRGLLWQEGAPLPAPEEHLVLPLALVQKIAWLKGELPAADAWRKYVATDPPRANHMDLGGERNREEGWSVIEWLLSPIEKALREHCRKEGWLTARLIKDLAQEVLDQSGIGTRGMEISDRNLKSLMENLNLAFESGGSPEMEEVFAEGEARSARLLAERGPGCRSVVLAAWRFRSPRRRFHERGNFTVIAARSQGSPDLFWVNNEAPTDRQCKRLMRGFHGGFRGISNYLTNYRRLLRFAPEGAGRHFIEPDIVWCDADSVAMRLRAACEIRKSIARQAASRAASLKQTPARPLSTRGSS